MFAILAIFGLKNLVKQEAFMKLKEVMLQFGNYDGDPHPNCSPSDVEKAVSTSPYNRLYINGDTGSIRVTEVDMSLKPTSKLIKLELENLNGSVTVERGNCGIIPLNANGLKIKVITPPRSEMMANATINVSAVMPPFIFNQQPEGVSVEFQFDDLKGVKEADAFLYESSFSLPEYKVLNSGYKFTYKSKTVSGKEYGEDESKEFVLGYFEVKKDGLSGGAIAGIVIGVVVVVAGVCVGVVYAVKCRGKKAGDGE